MAETRGHSESEAERAARYRRVRDRDALEILENDLVIIRAKKHEPMDFSGLPPRKIADITGKEFGSKFHPQWTLVRYVDWIRAEVERLRWTRVSGRITNDFRFSGPIGTSRGEEVSTIRLVSDGHYVHAYPVEDV